MVVKSKNKRIVIDPSKLKPGTAYIDELCGEKILIAKDNENKIRIYKIVK